MLTPLIIYCKPDAKKRPPPRSLMGVQRNSQVGEPYVHRNQLFYWCKPDAKKKETPPLTRMAYGGGEKVGRTKTWREMALPTSYLNIKEYPQQPAHFRQWEHPRRGYGNTSVNMILVIEGISEM
jgi:hypothetical protein